MGWSNFAQKAINNSFARFSIKIIFSLVIGLIGSTIVLNNLNQFAFYNFVLSQGAPTPESGFKYIEFFVVVLSIFLSFSSIVFGILLTIALASLAIPARIANRIVRDNDSSILKTIILLILIFLMVAGIVLVAFFIGNNLQNFTMVASDLLSPLTDVFGSVIFWTNRSQPGFVILLIVLLYVLVLIFRPQPIKTDGDKERNIGKSAGESSSKVPEKRSLFANILLFLVPLIFNSALLLYVGWTLKEPARYAELLRSIRHGGNMEVFLCFDDPEKYGFSVANCGDEFALNGEPSILIGHTDTEVIWRNLKSPDTYVTKWSEIKSYIIKAGKSGDFSDAVLREEFTNTGDVSYVPILQRADLQEALMVLLPR